MDENEKKVFRLELEKSIRKDVEEELRRRYAWIGYCQLKQNLAPSKCGAGNLIPDKSMDYSLVNILFSVQCSLS